MKRVEYLTWDDYFMSVAYLSAQRSKDPNKQVGACIVSRSHVILGIGYNGFPRGCSDESLSWARESESQDPLETKYPYVCHAEMNAILNKNTSSLEGSRLYVTMFPCNECAKLIIQAGIVEVIYGEDKRDGSRSVWPGSSNCKRPSCSCKPDATSYAWTAADRLFRLAEVNLRQHESDVTVTLTVRHRALPLSRPIARFLR